MRFRELNYKKIEDYNKGKWVYDGKKKVWSDEDWCYKEENSFRMGKYYKIYLYYKKEVEIYNKIGEILRKMNYEIDNYGDFDRIDFEECYYYINLYNNKFNKRFDIIKIKDLIIE